MLIDLPISIVVILNLIGWPIIQLPLAWLFTEFPLSWFTAPKTRKWEKNGTIYDHLFSVKKWKDRLPDGASWMSNGFAKGKLESTEPEYLQRFIQETWRGELCHWTAIACAPVFFLWNPLWADIVMVCYALLANLPCILAQRYNRIRLRKILDRTTKK